MNPKFRQNENTKRYAYILCCIQSRLEYDEALVSFVNLNERIKKITSYISVVCKVNELAFNAISLQLRLLGSSNYLVGRYI